MRETKLNLNLRLVFNRRQWHGLDGRSEESRAEDSETVPCGAEWRKGVVAERSRDSGTPPERRRSDLPAANPGGSKGDRIARTGPTVATAAHERSDSRSHCLALCHPALAACADLGALRGIPLEWGARDAAARAWGKAFPQPQNPVDKCS